MLLTDTAGYPRAYLPDQRAPGGYHTIKYAGYLVLGEGQHPLAQWWGERLTPSIRSEKELLRAGYVLVPIDLQQLLADLSPDLVCRLPAHLQPTAHWPFD